MVKPSDIMYVEIRCQHCGRSRRFEGTRSQVMQVVNQALAKHECEVSTAVREAGRD